MSAHRHKRPKRTPSEWCKREGMRILDPDGWRFAVRYGTPKWLPPKDYGARITRGEFMARACVSTQMIKHRNLAAVDVSIHRALLGG